MTAISWKEWCTAIKNQENCGACTAFGTLGAWEVRLRQKFGVTLSPDLSESDLFTCADGSNCITGNYVANILTRACTSCADESDFPYSATIGSCACGYSRTFDWWNRAYKMGAWKTVSGKSEMQTALANGPIIGVMAVYQSFFSYDNGIYERTSEQDALAGYHCIAIIGYDDAKGAWECRNSWGKDWGENGYFWLKYGACEIERFGAYEITEAGDKLEIPEGKYSKLTITPSEVTIPFMSTSTLDLLLVDEEGNAIQQAPIKISVGNIQQDIQMSLFGGHTYMLPTTLSSGTHTLVASFDGAVGMLGCSASAKITVENGNLPDPSKGFFLIVIGMAIVGGIIALGDWLWSKLSRKA